MQPLPLEPGDRLMFFTDGMLERNATDVDIATHARRPARRCIRAKPCSTSSQAILEATGGALNDDATALCLDWHGGPPRDRTTTSGADR